MVRDARSSVMRMHTGPHKLHPGLPIPLTYCGQLFGFGGDRDRVHEGTCRSCAQHERAAEEADEMVLLGC
jgi:hypothetical protein